MALFYNMLRPRAGADSWAYFQEKQMRKSVFLASATLAAASGFVPAAAVESFETVVVTATRSEQPLEKTGASVSIVDSADIASRQAVTLTDALAEVPGLSINRTGGVGQTTTVFLRGANSGQTVTLIDGIRLDDPSSTDDSTMYADLFVNNIDRIEVLRGAQSALYGSNAIGGVINIITKRGGETSATGQAEYGGFGHWRLNAAANGTVGPTEFGVAVNDYADKGISAYATGSEADGAANIAVNVNTRTRLADGVSLDLVGYYNHAHTDYDDGYAYDANYKYHTADSGTYNTHALYAGYAGLNADVFGGRLKNRLALIATSSKRDIYDSAWNTGHIDYDYDGQAIRVEYQGTAELDAVTELTFGAESERTSYANGSYYADALYSRGRGHKRITSGYGQLQRTFFDQLTLTGGVRLDSDEEFGDHTSVKLAAAWQVPGLDATVRGSFADGFKAPSLYQLFSDYSNPVETLNPETAKSWEAGFDKAFLDGRMTVSATWFRRLTGNQIDFQYCSDAATCSVRPYGYYVNIARSKAEGVETAASLRLNDTLSISANYTYLNATDRDTGLDLARRPHDLANAALRWQPIPSLGLGISVNYIGKRFDDAAEGTRLGAYETVSLFADYNIDAHWQVYGRIDNLFDDRTTRIAGYGVEGIGASFGLKVRT